MLNKLKKFIVFIFCCGGISACAHMAAAEIQQGKRYFDAGYYKRAMRQLMPYATDGDPQAAYAVGYMYYYGFGVAQDPDMGFLWIKRAAQQNYPPAVVALAMISKDKNQKQKEEHRFYLESEKLQSKGIGPRI